MKAHKQNLCVLLPDIRSAHNVGAIFRTADAVGVGKVYLSGYTPTPDTSDKIAKTALGAQMSVPWEYQRDAWRIIKKLKDQGYTIVALEQAPDAIDIFEYEPKLPLALIVGNEVTGISKAILQRADKIIAIPQYGQKESLNVAVATGIALYALTHRR